MCPFAATDNISIVSAYVRGSNCIVMEFKLTEESKYSLSPEQIKNYKKQVGELKKILINNKDFPNGSDCKILVKDKADRVLFEI